MGADGNLGPTVVIVAWTFTAVAIAVVFTRYYLHMKHLRKITIDDLLILITLIFDLGNSIFCTVAVHYGLGQHAKFLTPDQIKNSVKWAFLNEFFPIMGPGFGRVSFAILLYSIVPPTKWHRKYLISLMVIQLIADVITVIVTYSQCRPVNGYWDQSVHANCWPPTVQEHTGYFHGSVCSLVDLLLAIFPAGLFWQLQMKTSTKISLSILMGLGVFAMIASIVKTIELRVLQETNDYTYILAILALCWVLETNLVLIAASIPTLKPILKTPSSMRRNDSNNIQMLSWHKNKYKLSGKSTNKGGRSFVPLEDGIMFPDQNLNHTTATYEAGAYPSASTAKGTSPQNDNEIRKEMTTSVTYEQAHRMEKASDVPCFVLSLLSDLVLQVTYSIYCHPATPLFLLGIISLLPALSYLTMHVFAPPPAILLKQDLDGVVILGEAALKCKHLFATSFRPSGFYMKLNVEMARRVVIFGGQGSMSTFAPETSTFLNEFISSSVAASLLLSKCHSAFLEYVNSFDQNIGASLEIDPADFLYAASLIHPKARYHQNAILEATTLCLHQLLAYIAQTEKISTDFSTAFENVHETTGFCAGLLVATVVASSETIDQFIKFGVEAFRLSFSLASQLMLHCRLVAGDESLTHPWALVVHGIDLVELEGVLDILKGSLPSTLRIAAVSDAKSMSVSGLPSELIALKHRLGPNVLTNFVHIHAWYHGGEKQLAEVIHNVESDIESRKIRFPKFSDLKRPLRSTNDGSLIQVNATSSQLDRHLVKSLLASCVKWNATMQSMLEQIHSTLADKDTTVQLECFGPGTGYMLACLKTQQLPARLRIDDLSIPALATKQNPGPQSGDIAIVGMGINFPGGKGSDELWKTLLKGLNCIQEIPDSRFELSNYNSREQIQGNRQMNARHGGFLNDIWTFDNTFFSISPREALSMDPQQRILLHTAQSALDDAGYVRDGSPSFQRKSMGCYIGVATGDYVDNLRDSIDVFYSPGTLRAFHSGRLSYVNKLSGPCMTLDTACSSSLTAIYSACRAIQNGDCTAAIAGGVNTISSPDMYLGLDKGHFLSPSVGCKSFDQNADGYTRSEGCGLFVLKRLSDAVAENDRIHAVIKDVVINQSGNASSITHPDSEAQANLLQSLLRRTHVSPASIDVVEAHGTGTQAGDTREMSSLYNVFGQNRSPKTPLLVSSIKGSIGHCEAASGAAGLAKLVLMLRHKYIPQQGNLQKLNIQLPGIQTGQIVVPRENMSWQKTEIGPRRALLNNFGAAGSNGALILEEHSIDSDVTDLSHIKDRSALIFTLSAKSLDALNISLLEHLALLTSGKSLSIKDICYTATARRPLYDYRVAISCDTTTTLESELRRVDVSKLNRQQTKEKTIFVFSGQGSIYTGMGEELMSTSEIFLQHILRCDRVLKRLGFPSILPYFNGSSSGAETTMDIVGSQCALVALEYALGMLFMTWNVSPTFIIGHSLGEYAALAVAEVLSLEDTMRVVAQRAILIAEHCALGRSSMTAIAASANIVEKILMEQPNSQLSVACYNSPSSCVVAGPLEELACFETICKKGDIKLKRLDVPFGFHSSAMDPAVASLKALGSTIVFSDPKIPIASTVTGRIIRSAQDFPKDYFACHMRQPVLFHDAIQSLQNHGALDSAVFLEIGPHPTTLPMISSSKSFNKCEFIPTLHRGKSSWNSLSSTLCQLGSLAHRVNWREVFSSSRAKMIDLPEYPLRGEAFKVSFQECPKNTGGGNTSSSLPPGLSLFSKMSSAQDKWAFETNTDILGPHIIGHNVGGTTICPASTFSELAFQISQVALDTSKSDVPVVRDLQFAHPLIYDPANGVKVVIVNAFVEESKRALRFVITTRNGSNSEETECCSGKVLLVERKQLHKASIKDAALMKRQSSYIKGSSSTNRFHTRVLYDAVFTRVVSYSKDYQSLIDFNVSESTLEGLGTFQVPTATGPASRSHSFIRWSDVLFHSAGFVANLCVDSDKICICVHVGSIEILERDEIEFHDSYVVYCSLVNVSDDLFSADVFATNLNGDIVAALRGLEFHRLGLANFQHLLQLKVTNGTSLIRKPVETSRHRIEETPIPTSTLIKSTTTTTSLTAYNDEEQLDNKIATILCEVSGFKRNALHPDSTLNELGIDSMVQIELAHILNQTFPGAGIDHNDIANCSTVAAISHLISPAVTLDIYTPSRADNSEFSEAQLNTIDINSIIPSHFGLNDGDLPGNAMPIQILSRSEKPPLYLFHDGSGLIQGYKKIKEITRSFYAFSRPGLFDYKSPYATLADMAHNYVYKLSASNSQGIILGGWSFGGILALEAACQLASRGVPIRGLILIDSPYPGQHEPLPDAVIEYILPSTEDCSVSGSRAKLLEEFKHNASLLGTYTPPKTIPPFKTVLLQCQDTLDTESCCGVQYEWLCCQDTRQQAVENWSKLLGGDVKVLPVEGNHFQPFSAQFITTTSRQIESACKYLENV